MMDTTTSTEELDAPLAAYEQLLICSGVAEAPPPATSTSTSPTKGGGRRFSANLIPSSSSTTSTFHKDVERKLRVLERMRPRLSVKSSEHSWLIEALRRAPAYPGAAIGSPEHRMHLRNAMEEEQHGRGNKANETPFAQAFVKRQQRLAPCSRIPAGQR